MKLEGWWKKAFEKGVYPLGTLVRSSAWQKKTRTQISFILRTLRLPKGSKILDVGCGTGRHAIALSQRGYRVIGVDLSPIYLAEARQITRVLKLKAHFVRRDMRRIDFRRQFHAALSLFTSFGYFPKASDDLRVLRGIHRALLPGGLLLLDTLNGYQLHRRWVGKRWDELEDGSLALDEVFLLKKENAIKTRWIFIKNGAREEIVSFIRLYTRPGMTHLLRKAGFRAVRFWGTLEGSSYVPAQSHRLVVLARKPG